MNLAKDLIRTSFHLTTWGVVCALFFCSNYVHAQTALAATEGNLTGNSDSLIVPNVKIRFGTDPQTLANALIVGKTTDKEKLDAIFAWVVGRFRPSKNAIFSSRIQAEQPLKKILRKRNVDSEDIAMVMDSLCFFAGIQNVSIPGYVKEINFDINDSLYFDRHVWNAVKLDGYWYLYDAAWSAGQTVYEYTRFGKWRLDQINRLRQKTITKTIVFKTTNRGNSFCDDFPKTETIRYNSTRIKFFPRVLISIYGLFRFRLKFKYQKVRNTKYYLANPEVFALDHFPVIENWSLSTDVRTLNQFSADSSHYYNTANPFIKIQNNGRSCIPCEREFYLDSIPKEKFLKLASLQSNPLNRFIQSKLNLKIASLYFNEATKTNDSLMKMNFIDTTLTYLDSCAQELTKSMKTILRSDKFHRTKNRTKHGLCVKENRLHAKDIRKLFNITAQEQIKIRSLDTKASNYSKSGRKAHAKLRRDIHVSLSFTKMTELQLAKTRRDLKDFRLSADSLTALINSKQSNFLLSGPELWSNLLSVIEALEPIMNEFGIDGQLRLSSLLDHYDKKVVEARKQIEIYKNDFVSKSHEEIIRLSKSSYSDFVTLSNLVKKRNSIIHKCAKLAAKLSNAKQLSSDSLLAIETEMSQMIKDDVCWYYENEELIKSLARNFRKFQSQERQFNLTIRNNDKNERKRNKTIDKYNERIEKNGREAISKGKRMIYKVKKRTIEYRFDYLKKLRKEKKKKRKR